MRDGTPPPLADRLAGELSTVEWLTPEQIRARARRRTRLSLLAAPVVVLLLVGSLWTLIHGDDVRAGVPASAPLRPQPTEASTTLAGGGYDEGVRGSNPVLTPRLTRGVSTTPSSGSWVPPEAVLHPTDSGEEFQTRDEHTFSAGEHPAWIFDLSAGCPAYATLDIVAHRRHLFMRVRTLVGQTGTTATSAVYVQTGRFPAEDARQVLTDVRTVLAVCASYQAPTTAMTGITVETVHTWSTLDDGFAGDDSLLLRHEMVPVTLTEQAGPSVVSYAVIRVSDLVSVLYSLDDDAERMRQIAIRAAQRLCFTERTSC
jgi:hypothetical protein